MTTALKPGDLVTVIRYEPLRALRGRVRDVLEDAGVISGFSVRLKEKDRFVLPSAQTEHNVWDVDLQRSVEGIGWCHGWGDEATKALLVAAALA